MAKASINYTDALAVRTSFAADDGNGYDTKKLSASIGSIRSSGQKLDARIHATAHALMARALSHKDCSLVGGLIDAMPKSARRKALIAWFTAFSNVVILTDKAGKVTAKMHSPGTKSFKDDAEALLDKAWAKPFWSVEEKETDPAAFDSKRFALAVAALIKRAEGDNAALDEDGKAALADLKVLRHKLPADV